MAWEKEEIEDMVTQDMIKEQEKSLVTKGVPSKAPLRESTIRIGDICEFYVDLPYWALRLS